MPTAEEWLGGHRDDVSLMMDDGAGRRLRHHEDVPRVLASMIKVVHLLAYATAVAQGGLDPDEPVRVGAWDAWHPYDGDGPLGAGSHHNALTALGIPCDEYGVAHDPGHEVPLGAIADAMIFHSDNAAPDYLRARLGDAALRAAAARAGWPDPDVRPFCGETLRSFPEYARSTSDALAERFVRDQEFRREVFARVQGPPLSEDVEWAWTQRTGHGSAAQLFAVHRSLATETYLPAEAGALARRLLSRPFADHVPPGAGEVLFKGGSLPRTFTVGMSVRHLDGHAGTLALLLTGTGIPASAMIDLCLDVLSDPARFAGLTESLGVRPDAG